MPLKNTRMAPTVPKHTTDMDRLTCGVDVLTLANEISESTVGTRQATEKEIEPLRLDRTLASPCNQLKRLSYLPSCHFPAMSRSLTGHPSVIRPVSVRLGVTLHVSPPRDTQRRPSALSECTPAIPGPMGEPVAAETVRADHAAPRPGGQLPVWWTGAYPFETEEDTEGLTKILAQDVTFLVKGLVASLPIAMMVDPFYHALGKKERLQEELLQVKRSLCESLPIVDRGRVGDKHATLDRVGDCGPAALYKLMDLCTQQYDPDNRIAEPPR